LRFSLFHKLFLAFTLCSAAALILMALLIKWQLDRGFLDYLNQAEMKRHDGTVSRLEGEYRLHGWERLRHNRRLWRRLTSDGRPPEPQGAPPPRRDDRRPPPSRDGPPGEEHLPKLALYDSLDRPIIGHGPPGDDMLLRSIEVDGELVAKLAIRKVRELTEIDDVAFIQSQIRALYLFTALLALIALIAAVILTRHFRTPITALGQAADRLAHGDFRARVQSRRRDELGRLALNFNHLATTLEKTDESRKRWIADISHELRTPLSILRGELEAVQDGVREMTRETIDRLHSDVMRLTLLVDDLYNLSLSEVGSLRYQMRILNPAEIVEQVCASYRDRFAERDLSFHHEIHTEILIYGDPQRLFQLVTNLLENSLRYTDPGGEVRLRVEDIGDDLILRVEDSAPGLSAKDCPKIFDRFVRYNRGSGGGGLGLAICRNIVEAHEGEINAKPSSRGGLEIQIRFPGATP